MKYIKISDDERKIELDVRRRWGVQVFDGRNIINGSYNKVDFIPNRTTVKYVIEFEKWLKSVNEINLDHIGVYMSICQYISRYGDKESNEPSEMFDRGYELVKENIKEFDDSPIDSPVKYAFKILEEYGYEWNCN
ncbi:MAG: hypothetical protein KAH32_05240 [Chlamydiia bacterium]|nr:hypothetical protein [Chlamydiia bacterium]